MLALGEFLQPLEKFTERRNAGLILTEKGETGPPLPIRSAAILKELAIKGALGRGEIYRVLELNERTGRRVFKSLLTEGLLAAESKWHRAPVRLGFPAQFAAYLFPGLFPEV